MRDLLARAPVVMVDVPLPVGLSGQEFGRFRKAVTIAMAARMLGVETADMAELDANGRESLAGLAGYNYVSPRVWRLALEALEIMRGREEPGGEHASS